MARPRRQHQADDAAKAASEAARVLQQRGQEVKEQVPSNPNMEPPEGWTPPKRYSEHRGEMMEEILASRPKAEKPAEPPAEEKVEAVPEAPPVEEPAPEPVPETPKVVRVKVDGEEFDAPAEEVESYGGVKAYQIHRASENRLKKINDVLAETRRAQAEFLEQQRAMQKPKEPDVTDEQFIASKMDTIRFGTPEEAAKAQLEILQRVQKPLDQNALIEHASNKFRHDQAVTQFDTEFQDVVSNPMLLKLVVALRNERIPQLKGSVDWNHFYRAIGNEVRSITGKPTSSTAVQSTTSGIPSQQSDKEAKKAAVATVLPTSSARAELPKEEKPETRDDMIRSMRKRRGLPVD